MLEADVVVVGAGLAGLSAAYRLRGAGVDVLVLEAAAEVGGRTRSRLLGGEVVEFGAEWLGRGHTHLMALLRELGISARLARQIYYPLLWRGRSQSQLLLPRLAPRELGAVPRAIRHAAKLARELDPASPWQSRTARELDQVSFGDWLRAAGIDGEGYYFFGQVIGALSSTPIERLSLLHVLWWIRRGGGPLRILWTTFERNVPGGVQTIAQALAERLPGRVMLGAQVRAIAQSQTNVEVVTASGTSVRARQAIVTAPPGTLHRILFDPALPPELASVDGLSIDPGTKVVAYLPPDRIPVHRVFVGGALLSGGWRVGPRVTGFAPVPAGDAPDEDLIADLAEGFGVDAHALRSPGLYHWSQHRFLPGCDVGFAPGQLTRHGPHLREAHGRVHFAGAERSSWPNNMEGAVESGTQLAREVLEALQR